MTVTRELRPDGTDPEVILCGEHAWTIEDRTPRGIAPGNPYYICQYCVGCEAFRCDSVDNHKHRCVEARHHNGVLHRTGDGTKWPIGGSPPVAV